MNTLQHIIQSCLGEKCKDLELPLLRFLLKASSSSNFKSEYRDIRGVDSKPKDLEAALYANGYAMKNLKLFLWAAYKSGAYKKRVLCTKLARGYKVKPADVSLCSYLYSSQSLRSKLHKIKNDSYLTLEQMDSILSNLYEDKTITEFTTKFVFKKLRFITKSNYQTTDDLIVELKLWSLHGVMKQYPKFESPLHMYNFAKRITANQGKNLIMNSTRQKRKNLIKQSDGFISSAVSLSSLEHVDLSSGDLSFTHEKLEPHNTDEELTTKVSYERLLKTYVGKKRKFIELISGTFDPNFSKYLKRKRINMQNDEYFDRCMSHGTIKTIYVGHITTYLGITNDCGSAFMQELAQDLAH